MTEQQTCTACGVGGHTAARCHWDAPGALESIQLPKHTTTIALDELLAGYLPVDRESVREAIEAYADIQARKAVMLFSGAALAPPFPAPELEADREAPQIVAFIHDRTGAVANADMVRVMEEGSVPSGYTIGLMTATQHDRIALERWQYFRRKMRQMRDLMRGMRDRLNAAQDRVTELDLKLATSDYAYDSNRSHMRGIAQDAADAIQVFTGHDSGANLTHRYGEKWWEPLNELRDQLRAFVDGAPVAQAVQIPQAWTDVQAERRSQVEEKGWAPEHDDAHVCDEIAAYACFFIMPPAARDWDASSTGYGDTLGAAILPPDWLPKIGDRRRELVKGAALALAEIERLDRAADQAQGGRDE